MSCGLCAAPAVRRQSSTSCVLPDVCLAALPVAAHEEAALMLDKAVLSLVGAPTRAGAAPRERVANLALSAPVLGLVPGIDGA